MKLKIVLDGVTYVSKTTTEIAERVATKHFVNGVTNTIDEFSSFKTELKNGEFMVLGPDACRKAIFLYVP